MGLLQKKPQILSSIPLYSLASENTFAIIGLGNIGKKYENTRHNAGFLCVDAFAREHQFPKWESSKKLQADITKTHLSDSQIIIQKPATLMNNSGRAVKQLLRYHTIETKNCIVVHDDIDIPLGQIRSRLGGGSGGHNGIKSIISDIGEEFGRIRVGIGPKEPEDIDSSDFVLGTFTRSQKDILNDVTKEVTALLTEIIFADGTIPIETRNVIT